jgi:hypothetical protein
MTFAKLELGAGTPLELDKYSKWKQDAATDIAFSLLTYLWKGWRENRSEFSDYAALGERIDELPKFTDDSSDQWWKLAKAVFLFSYPEPQTIRELAALVTTHSKKKSPGRIKQGILEKLKGRFKSLARACQH